MWQSAEFIMENITGPMSYSIVLDSKKQDGVSEPNFGIQIIDSMKANKVPVAIASPKVFIGAMLET
jgi:hypothetical protein